MKVAFFSVKPFERRFFDSANGGAHDIRYLDARLDETTAPLAEGCEVACGFVADRIDAQCLESLASLGVRLIALRSAGFNHVDLDAVERLGLTVARVPAYSPYAVAEHTVALMLALNRKTHRAYNRTREHNFSLEGLMGFDMRGKTAGIVGTGKIGGAVASILAGFGCELLGHDVEPSEECLRLGMRYLPLDEMLPRCDILTLHCPLTPETHHLIDDRALDAMKHGAMLINTSRGAVVNTKALIRALKARRIGSLGLDVYEEEGDLFFRDLSEDVMQDDVFARLLTFPNVIVTGHQGFFTREAIEAIARTTIDNITAFAEGRVPPENLVSAKRHVARA